MNNKVYKKIFILFMIATLSVVCSCSKGKENNFNFASYKTAEKVPYKIYYEDEYFDDIASNYNPSLASASACLALAGFSSETKKDYDKSAVNAEELFATLGFSNFLSNEDGINKPTADSFGVYIANKQIEDYTLLGITVRGAGYLSEWSSNFKIDMNDDFAQGFFDASEIYLNHLKDYIQKYEIKGHIKIWTAGYSRGGATVNIVAGRIDDALKNNQNIISNEVTYTKDDIYAYSFEAPAGKIATLNGNEIIEKGNDYSNIFTVLNLNDPVPFVAPLDYSFVRYGTDLFLPDIITDLNYEKQINTVKAKMKDLPNYKTVGDYQIDMFGKENTKHLKYANMSIYPVLSEFISNLCEAIGTKEDYVNKIQPAVRGIFELLYEKTSPRESLINLGINIGRYLVLYDINGVFLYDLQHNVKKFIKDLRPILNDAIKLLNQELDTDSLTTLITTLLSAITEIVKLPGGFDSIRPLIHMNNLKALGSAHIPELLLCHITSLDHNYNDTDLKVTNSFNKLIIKTKSEFSLLINNKEYVYFENNELKSNFVTKIEEDRYIIYLPSNVDFVVDKKNNIFEYELYNHNNKYKDEVLVKIG